MHQSPENLAMTFHKKYTFILCAKTNARIKQCDLIRTFIRTFVVALYSPRHEALISLKCISWSPVWIFRMAWSSRTRGWFSLINCWICKTTIEDCWRLSCACIRVMEKNVLIVYSAKCSGSALCLRNWRKVNILSFKRRFKVDEEGRMGRGVSGSS